MLSLVRRQLRRSLLYWILLSVFIRNHCGTGLARACNRSGQRSTQHNRVQQHGAEPPADCCSARKAPAAVQRHATYRFLFCALASVILVRKLLCDGMVSGGSRWSRTARRPRRICTMPPTDHRSGSARLGFPRCPALQQCGCRARAPSSPRTVCFFFFSRIIAPGLTT